jgi:hypothetical protein
MKKLKQLFLMVMMVVLAVPMFVISAFAEDEVWVQKTVCLFILTLSKLLNWTVHYTRLSLVYYCLFEIFRRN